MVAVIEEEMRQEEEQINKSETNIPNITESSQSRLPSLHTEEKIPEAEKEENIDSDQQLSSGEEEIEEQRQR